MGLFDFVKDAGAKVFGQDDAAHEPQARQVDPEKRQRFIRNLQMKKVVEKLGVEVEGLEVEVDGDTAVVHGTVDSQTEREKVVLAVGNVAGIARVDDRMTARVEVKPARFHTVEKGESLSLIAKKYYGDAMKYPVIFKANKPMLDNPDRIYPGQVLRIPEIDG